MKGQWWCGSVLGEERVRRRSTSLHGRAVSGDATSAGAR
jgi:hypothetical protein